jgi:tetratricopeptide (TPR) repeat protein
MLCNECINNCSISFLDSYYYKGEALYGLKRYQKSIDCLTMALQVSINDPRYHFSTGKIFNFFAHSKYF